MDIDDAVLSGDFERVKYLYKKGERHSRLTCVYAAKGGHLEILKWLKEQGAPLEETCYFAAKTGDLSLLKWLRKEGTPWNEEICYESSLAGQSEVLKYMRKHGCVCGGKHH
jgi:hypothetical protein